MERLKAESDPKQETNPSKEEYEKLLHKLQELEALREKFLRSAADFDNARKRLAREREEFIRYSQEKFLRDILPILDNFERALAHAEGGDRGVSAGIQLIWKQLVDLTASYGLKRLSVEGQPFDPHFHEAVDHVIEEGPEGIVLKELVAGYTLYDRVLRPAKVRIRISPPAKEMPPQREEEKEEEIT